MARLFILSIVHGVRIRYIFWKIWRANHRNLAVAERPVWRDVLWISGIKHREPWAHARVARIAHKTIKFLPEKKVYRLHLATGSSKLPLPSSASFILPPQESSHLNYRSYSFLFWGRIRKLLRSPGIASKESILPSLYRPGRQIKPRGSDSSKPWNLFLGSLKFYKFELWTP